jgi:hypothetical protein
LQLAQFASLVFPIVGIRHWRFALGDAFPIGQQGQFGIELGHVHLVGWQVFFSIDGIDGALWNADGAIDALIGVNGQKVWAFTEAVYWADVHAVGVFAADTGFRNNVGHDNLLKLWRYTGGIARKVGILRQFRPLD